MRVRVYVHTCITIPVITIVYIVLKLVLTFYRNPLIIKLVLNKRANNLRVKYYLLV